MSKIVITNVDEAPWVREAVQDDGRKTGAQIVGEVDEGLRAFIMNVADANETFGVNGRNPVSCDLSFGVVHHDSLKLLWIKIGKEKK